MYLEMKTRQNKKDTAKKQNKQLEGGYVLGDEKPGGTRRIPLKKQQNR